MILRELWDYLEDRLFAVPSSDSPFNQYRDSDPTVDLPNAHEIRKLNLKNYFFQNRTERPSILVVGEAAGPWGCRFSGVPFTGEIQLLGNALPFSGQRSSRDKPTINVPHKPPYTSLSAKTFWAVMKHYHNRFFAWNCVPLHPHKQNPPLSVRTPTSQEVSFFAEEILKEVIRILDPKEILVVGRKAEKSVKQLGRSYRYIRHPAHGGTEVFKAQMQRAFQVD